jgi:hypothetical protein
MEQSKALTKLLEAADLTGMLEDLANSALAGKLTPSSLAGMRITLDRIRETILSSHDALASGLVTQSRSRTEQSETTTPQVLRPIAPRDLRASIEKFVEK